MIHAYSENYLDDAMRNLGEAFDFASAVCHLDLDSFLQCSSIPVLQIYSETVTQSMLPDYQEQNLPWKLCGNRGCLSMGCKLK